MRILIDEATIDAGVTELARSVTAHYAPGPLTVLGVMTGSLMLLADLLRKLELPLRVGVVQASSYRGTLTAGDLRIEVSNMPDVRGHDVLLVDDIFDTGRTLEQLMQVVADRGAKSVRAAVLLAKQGRAVVSLRPDFQVFEIPDEFVVGYGLDHCDRFRNLPYVAVLEPSDLSELQDQAPF